MVLLDFSRAFDSINIPLLLAKLVYYGFEPGTVNWFSSYLHDRIQVVGVNKQDGSRSFSAPCSVNRVVPQGSILGPLLFILYTADVCKNIKFCKYHLYADDIQVYLSFDPSESDEAVAKINTDLQNIALWSEVNALVLNPSKSKFMILGSERRMDRIVINKPDINILSKSVQRVREARNLGVRMDDGLRFEGHVLEIVRNCFYRLKVLYRVRDFLNEEVRVRLCTALILSRLGHADTVYGSRLLARTKRIIQRIQNACARYIFNIPPRAHVSPYLNAANILQMEKQRDLHLATLLFGVLKSKKPEYLFEKLKFRKKGGTQSIRLVSSVLQIPEHRTAAFRGSFRYAATKCWNNLPPPIRQLNTVASFRFKLKKHFLLSQKMSSGASGWVVPA